MRKIIVIGCFIVTMCVAVGIVSFAGNEKEIDNKKDKVATGVTTENLLVAESTTEKATVKINTERSTTEDLTTEQKSKKDVKLPKKGNPSTTEAKTESTTESRPPATTEASTQVPTTETTTEEKPPVCKHNWVEIMKDVYHEAVYEEQMIHEAVFYHYYCRTCVKWYPEVGDDQCDGSDGFYGSQLISPAEYANVCVQEAYTEQIGTGKFKCSKCGEKK